MRFVNVDKRLDEFGKVLRNVQASIQSLETQVRHFARANSERPLGSFPSNTENNPRDLKALTLRSVKQFEAKASEGPSASNERVAVQEDPTPTENLSDKSGGKQDEVCSKSLPPKVPEYKPPMPYPVRLKKDKEDAQFKKFLNIFKQLHINIPLIDGLSQMPKYTKFMKDLLANKWKLEDLDTMTFSGNCLVVFQKKLPKTLTDPGIFIIPCMLGEGMQENALADSGASINVIPYTLFLKLGLDDLKPTRMRLQLADHSIRKPRGVVEDVLVKVDKLIIPVDFVILDVDADVEVPLILGRPFLNTAGALIDVKGGKMTLRVGDEKVVFTLLEAMRQTLDHDDPLFFTDATDMVISDCVHEVLALNPLEEYLGTLDDKEDRMKTCIPTPREHVNFVGTNPTNSPKKKKNVKKVWRKVNKKSKGRVNLTLSPPR
ncbi:uncharacterized protein LOC120271544 [Dioscorea cayenensis subsp. rotundata]|uniref:Uncharacterized protein LOC120271544 n=1 Tax=Dioscorea cayennensis subsp. rotundata TaxID=55577 RepID=A0AB40C324_DIOCR|nr:uncharacterized protein LOC120271544 [Dioscorea cayenensis subsp. rotundata]